MKETDPYLEWLKSAGYLTEDGKAANRKEDETKAEWVLTESVIGLVYYYTRTNGMETCVELSDKTFNGKAVKVCSYNSNRLYGTGHRDAAAVEVSRSMKYLLRKYPREGVSAKVDPVVLEDADPERAALIDALMTREKLIKVKLPSELSNNSVAQFGAETSKDTPVFFQMIESCFYNLTFGLISNLFRVVMFDHLQAGTIPKAVFKVNQAIHLNDSTGMIDNYKKISYVESRVLANATLASVFLYAGKLTAADNGELTLTISPESLAKMAAIPADPKPLVRNCILITDKPININYADLDIDPIYGNREDIELKDDIIRHHEAVVPFEVKGFKSFPFTEYRLIVIRPDINIAYMPLITTYVKQSISLEKSVDEKGMVFIAEGKVDDAILASIQLEFGKFEIHSVGSIVEAKTLWKYGTVSRTPRDYVLKLMDEYIAKIKDGAINKDIVKILEKQKNN